MRRKPKAHSKILAFYDGKVVDMSYIEDAGRRFSFAAMRVSDNAGKGYVIDSGRVYAITPASRKALVLPAAQAELVLEQASAIAPHLFAQSAPRERAASTTVLDRLLDRVQAGQREITFDTEGYTESHVQRLIATAQDRGLHASYDGRFVLVRDLDPRASSQRVGRSVRPPSVAPAPREPAHRRQLRMDTGVESFALTHPTAPSRPERPARQLPVSERQAAFDIDTRPRFRR